MKKFLHLLVYIRPYSRHAVLNVIFNILSAFFALFSFTLVIPFLQILFGTHPLVEAPGEFVLSAVYLKAVLNFIISNFIRLYGSEVALLLICIMVVVATLLKTGFRFLANYYMTPIRTGILRDIRTVLYDKILYLPLSFFTEKRKGDMLTRVTADVLEIELSIMNSLEMLFRDPFTIILFIVFLFMMSPPLTFFVIILLPLSGFFIGRVGKTLRSVSRKGQTKLGIITSIVEETLTGLRVIKAFNGEEKMKRQFARANQLFTILLNRIQRRRYLATPLSEFLSTLVLMVLMYYGGRLVLGAQGGLTPEGFITYLVVFSQVITPAKSVSIAYFNIQKGMASADRINEVLNTEITITEPETPEIFNEFREKIEYRNVYFKYEEEYVLQNINLVIEKGKTIALVGKSGSGKSTLADLLPRFMDVTSGDILIDGKSIRQYSLHQLRDKIGVVSQQPILFNDTFFNNIAFGVERATEQEVKSAAQVANADEFISGYNEGYYYRVGEQGVKLSGGQKQRVSIARAVLKNPPILILDEATSSLDTESEKMVQDAIINLMKNRTSIVIAHRLSTVKHADEIIVLEDGRIIERGCHDELMQKKGRYYQLVEMQSIN